MDDENKATAFRLKELIKATRKSALFRQLIPAEALTGWPAPLNRQGKLCLLLPFFSAHSVDKGKTNVYPPFCSLVVTYPQGVIVQYTNFHYKNPYGDSKVNQPVGLFPHEAIAGMKIKEYTETREELMAMYDEMFTMIYEGQSWEIEWEAAFKQKLGLLMEPSLQSFYMKLAPRFFEKYLS